MDLEIERAVLAQVVLMGRELERAEAELRGLIDRLDTDEQAEMIAIMWIGRGAFEPDDWDEAVQTAEAEATTPCADYLLGTPHFTDHLEAGMEALGLPLGDDEDALFR
ncbi:MAG: DUF3775 domain-containing protein [Pseudomonadota bacterium]